MELESFSRRRNPPVGRGLRHQRCPLPPPRERRRIPGRPTSSRKDATSIRPAPRPCRPGSTATARSSAAPAYSGSAGRSVSQGLQYPAPILISRPAAPAAASMPSCQRKLLYRPEHVGGAGNEPGGFAVALGDDQERVGSAADPPVQALQEAGTQQREESPGDLSGVESGATPASAAVRPDGDHRGRVADQPTPTDRRPRIGTVGSVDTRCPLLFGPIAVSHDLTRQAQALTACHNTW